MFIPPTLLKNVLLLEINKIFGVRIKKIAIFVDGSNLFHACQNEGLRIDYQKLKETIEEFEDDWELTRPYFYGSKPKKIDPKQDGFYNNLRYMGYELKIFELKEYSGGRKEEKMVDIALATDVLLFGHRDNFDIAIFMTGDRDYAPAIEAVKDMGKKVIVSSFECVMSDELKKIADNYICLDDLVDKIKR